MTDPNAPPESMLDPVSILPSLSIDPEELALYVERTPSGWTLRRTMVHKTGVWRLELFDPTGALVSGVIWKDLFSSGSCGAELDLSPTEAATVARIENAEPAPESWAAQRAIAEALRATYWATAAIPHAEAVRDVIRVRADAIDPR